MRDFVRIEGRGAIDGDHSKQLILQLAAVAAFNPAAGILIDLTGTTLEIEDTGHLLRCAAELVRYKNNFRHKIAAVIANDDASISMAKALEVLMDIQSLKYRAFTEMKDAIDWLAEDGGTW